MPLEKLRLKNFQGFSKFEIEFDQHITTIVGPSDVGKSAVIRAIKWLVFNKPSGEAYRKWGSKNTVVGLQYDEGNTLIRKKSDSLNEMKLNQKRYVAFGTGMPEDISVSLNLSDENFQFQHDAPFWLSSTSGQVSRELNAIVNLDVIDTTLKNLASEVKKARIERDSCETRLKTATEEKDSLAYVEELSSDFGGLEKLEKEVAQKATRLAHLTHSVEEASKYVKAKETYRKAHSDGISVVSVGEKWKKTEKQLKKLELMISNAVGANKDASVELPTNDEIENVLKSHEEYKQKINKYVELEGFVDSAVKNRKRWVDADQDVLLAKRELNDKSEGICPVCGNDMKEGICNV